MRRLALWAALGVLLFGCREALAEDSMAAAGAKIRFGLGLASLAQKQCPGLQFGPAFFGMMASLQTAADARGAVFDAPALLVQSEGEALETLAGADVCAAAAKAAEPGGVIEAR